MDYNIGLDVGSTTVKLVALDEEKNIKYSIYKRHLSDVEETVREVVTDAYEKLGDSKITMMVTGSGGMFVEKYLKIPFIQEVVAGTTAIRAYIPDTDVAIELGGEDSKITYLSGNVEQRMNSICAGGTGAFIDQMASLLETDASGLNEMSKSSEKVFPIASRCGVFAKTDVQALINQGTSKEDIAVSVFQSVVNQTISNLACGRPIKGNIAFLGGPLHFLSELGERFKETLGSQNQYYLPKNSQLFVAMGAALASKEGEVQEFSRIISNISKKVDVEIDKDNELEPLFTSEEEIAAFKDSHKTSKVRYGDLESYEGPLYLGIDAGSTTSKIILLDEDNKIVYSHYANNKGKPLELVIEELKEIYKKMNPNAQIVASGITGYGEDFIKAALNVDIGEVETIAHYRAAKFFDEDVDFILDIGGQDMKAMHITDGVIDSIQLNEACSSGCGSFIETFSKSLHMDVEEFQEEALRSKHPVDLGSRCTVFMNSKVKQAQKEGATVGDIAAGLCYSVIKNAIQKVIKVRDPQKLGKNIVVQGGTFYGDAILRAFEKVTGRIPVRPSIAGLMGAMGMALIAREHSTGQSTIADLEFLEGFSYKQKQARCGLCSNNCALSINIFSNGKKYITGNRCERGAGIVTKDENKLPNLYNYKYKRLFDYYTPLTESQAHRGSVGIPRVLNMYENYPIWFTFLTSLGFKVVLSEESTRETYERGISSIPSETACYPAKIVHGHIEELVEKDVDFIFYPSVFYEKQEFDKADNNINCPVVIGYPDLIKNNVDSFKEEKIKFMNPFISLQDKEGLIKRMAEEFKDFDINYKEVSNAMERAWNELERFREDIKQEGQRALDYMEEKGIHGIVLSGRPYHIDPEIHHGIPQLITSLGLAVLSEDSVLSYKEDVDQELRVLDQWVYHSRLYRAAELVGDSKNLDLVQLNSFGCGLDAVTTDQVKEILERKGKIYTTIKIDEVSNLGAVKIRLRSLTQALRGRKLKAPVKAHNPKKVEFTKSMKKDYTILAPQMAPDHFEILQSALESDGYHFEFLKTVDTKVIDEGLKYVNNDSCYPSITVVGQFMDAVKSGKYDVDKLALLMSQTGGACRASNYVGYIRKALIEAGYPQIPVIALSAQGIETNEGFNLTATMLNKSLMSMLYGDLIMRVANATRPYEIKKGETDKLKEEWIEKCRVQVRSPRMSQFKKNIYKIVEDFEAIPIEYKEIPRVGIVGEILVKYLPEANNNLQDILEAEGAEVILPDLTDFIMYSLRNAVHKHQLLSKGRFGAIMCDLGVKFIELYRRHIRKALEKSRYDTPLYVEELEKLAEPIVSLGNQYGEGWLLTAEMLELIEAGAANIVCIQPFGCLPNHITGKGVIKRIREIHSEANIIPIDYDPGASEVNQVNRIKLMMNQARENLEETKEPEHSK